MNYQRIHDEIIADSRISSPIGFKHDKTMGYKERHHIIPRCLGGTNEPQNLVYLTARRHFIIHKILTKIYPNNKKLWFAFQCMYANSNNKRSSDIGWVKSVSKNYEKLKQKISTLMIGNNHNVGKRHSIETKKKMSIAAMGNKQNIGSKRSPQAIKNMSLAQQLSYKTRIISTETRIAIGNANRKRIWTEESKKKISASFAKEDNKNWNNKSFENSHNWLKNSRPNPRWLI